MSFNLLPVRWCFAEKCLLKLEKNNEKFSVSALQFLKECIYIVDISYVGYFQENMPIELKKIFKDIILLLKSNKCLNCKFWLPVGHSWCHDTYSS